MNLMLFLLSVLISPAQGQLLIELISLLLFTDSTVADEKREIDGFEYYLHSF